MSNSVAHADDPHLANSIIDADSPPYFCNLPKPAAFPIQIYSIIICIAPADSARLPAFLKIIKSDALFQHHLAVFNILISSKKHFPIIEAINVLALICLKAAFLVLQNHCGDDQFLIDARRWPAGFAAEASVRLPLATIEADCAPRRIIQPNFSHFRPNWPIDRQSNLIITVDFILNYLFLLRLL